MCKRVAQNLTFTKTYHNFLGHPKLKHYLSVAMISDGKLLREPAQNLPHTCHTVEIDILIHPESQDIPKALDQALQVAQLGGGTMRPELLTAVETGYFGFHGGLKVKVGPQSGVAVDLWKSAKETQRNSDDPSRVNNPVVLIDWRWNNTTMTCAMELNPYAFADARNGSVCKEMRLDGGYGPLMVDNQGGRCNLLTCVVNPDCLIGVDVSGLQQDGRVH